MKSVTFTQDYDHWTPAKTTSFKAGQTVEVSDAIAEAAAEKGKIDGRGSDPGSAAGSAAATEGRSGGKRPR